MNSRRQFIRQIGLATVGLTLTPKWTNNVQDKTSKLPRSTPEAQGVSTEAINKYFDAVEASGQEFHATIILKNGFVIAEAWWEPYGPDHKMQLYSMSKSFTSTAIGFAQQEGLLNVEDLVIKYFPKDLPDEISPNLKALKIKHLLMMSVGHAKDSILTIEHSPAGVAWAKTFLAIPIEFEPGTKFLYNSGASFMLANIVQKVSGKTAFDFLKPRLFEPLGITNTTWSTTPEGYNFGASHLRMTTEDMAKFGQFYLQKGKWKGKQLLNTEYIATATSKQISNGKNDSSWAYGYGYQFWLNPPGGFRADGAFGQYSMVFPDQNAVVAINSESLGKGITMSLVWDILFPALGKKEPLKNNPTAHASLKTKLKGLRYAPEKFEAKSAFESNINGKKFQFEPNDLGIQNLTFRFNNDTISFDIKEEGFDTYTITSGRNKWYKKGNRKPAPHALFSRRRIDFESLVAAAAGWENEHTLKICLRLIETCHSDYLTCIFNDNKLTINTLFSVQKTEGKPDDRKPLMATIV